MLDLCIDCKTEIFTTEIPWSKSNFKSKTKSNINFCRYSQTYVKHSQIWVAKVDKKLEHSQNIPDFGPKNRKGRAQPKLRSSTTKFFQTFFLKVFLFAKTFRQNLAISNNHTWTRDTGDANSNFRTGNRQRVGRGKSQQREQEQKHNETVRIRRKETDQRSEEEI